MNTLLIVSGSVLICLGIYRENAITNFRSFFYTNGPIFTIFLMLFLWLSLLGGKSYATQCEKITLQMASLYLPMMFMLIPIMGVGMVVSDHYQNEISELLRGKYGYIGSLGAAFASPTSVALSKFVESIWVNKAVRPQLLYLLTATPLVSWNILLIRQMGLGWNIAMVMYKTNWIVAVGLMFPFWIWGKFFV